MILLGIDHGTRRMGFATGDTSVSLAFPLKTIEVINEKQAARIAAMLAREEKVERIIVGMPYRMTGESDEGETVNTVRQFIDQLRMETDIPIAIEDERYTSSIAERRRKEVGISGKKFDKDAEAAALILESYLLRHHQNNGRSDLV